MTVLNEELALALITEDYDAAEWQSVEGDVDAGHVKHDITAYYSIFKRLSDNTFWKVSFDISYDYGLDEYSVYSEQVQKVEVITTRWKTVKGDIHE